ncbi:MAG: hypothetical protein K0U45_04610 [Alphaproteobacteria bacterium]|nr:hypothetical protein [Alphaproteobacteria bacterium]
MNLLANYLILIFLILIVFIFYARHLANRYQGYGRYRLNGTLLGGITILGGLMLYLLIGAPFLPDFPVLMQQNITDNSNGDSGRAPVLDKETLQQVQQMTPEEQQAMIENMVTGLAQRLEENPDDIDGLRRLARAYQVLGRQQEYIDVLKKATIITPDDVGLLLALSRALRAQNSETDNEETRSLLQKILTIEPNNREALLFMGINEWQNGNQQIAQTYFDRVLQNLDKDSEIYKELEIYINKVVE